MTGKLRNRILFILISLVAVATASVPIKAVMSNPRVDIYYTHLPFIPLLSAFLIIRKRKEIFSNPTPAYAPWRAKALLAWPRSVFTPLRNATRNSLQALPRIKRCLYYEAAFSFYVPI
jgi:hypothetical protein